MPQPGPADFARSALKRIAEMRLPPTPDHFQKFYLEAAGLPPAENAAAAVSPGRLDPAVIQRFDDLVGKAVDTTQSLVTDLGRHDQDLTASLESLVSGADGGEASGLLRSMSAMSQDIFATVRASHAELLEARRGLHEIKLELLESRKQLGQDPLTGTENRRAMDAILSREISRARRDGQPLAVAMVDIDHFKKINDTHGHAAGDAALIHLTQLAKSLLRGNDAFIRYGGEEFLLVLPETGLQGGVFAAQRLQKMLAREILTYERKSIMMTLSGGVSVLNGDDTEDSLVRRADVALYKAKNAGRNLVLSEP